MLINVCYKLKENIVFGLSVLCDRAHISEKDEEDIIPSKSILTSEAFVIQSLTSVSPLGYSSGTSVEGLILIMQCS